jgi:hypothetical protein
VPSWLLLVWGVFGKPVGAWWGLSGASKGQGAPSDLLLATGGYIRYSILDIGYWIGALGALGAGAVGVGAGVYGVWSGK